jgi:hypothetical protein
MLTSSILNWVDRGGIATPSSLQLGYSGRKAVSGLYGFSVQYAPGQSLDALMQAGQFRNAQISYADRGNLEQAVQPLGYKIQLVKSPGHGFHHTFAVLYTNSGTMLQALPQDAAEAINWTFQRMLNLYRMP